MPAASIVMSFSDYNLGFPGSAVCSGLHKTVSRTTTFSAVARLLLLQNGFQLAVCVFFVIGLEALQVFGPRIRRARTAPAPASLQQQWRVVILRVALQHRSEPVRRLVEHTAFPQSVAHIELVRRVALIAVQGFLEVIHGLRQIAAGL